MVLWYRGGTVKINEKGFIICPKCNRPTKVKVRPDTVLLNFPLYCTWCKEESLIKYKPEQIARAII